MSIAKDTIMDILYTYQDSLLKMVSSQFHRYLYHEIDWTLRMIGIRGQRGVGKSTLVLQYIKENKLHQDGNGLYITMDHPYFYQHSLFDTIHEFYKIGGRYIFIDEIHKYPRIKNKKKRISAAVAMTPRTRITGSGTQGSICAVFSEKRPSGPG